ERDDQIILWGGKRHIDAAFIGRRGAGRPTVVFVLAMLGDRICLGPAHSGVVAIQANDQPLTGWHVAACDEEAIAPEDRRGMPLARQFHFPEAVALGPRDVRGTDAGTVGAAETGPVLSGTFRREQTAGADTNHQ